jgi:hypothetical protein
MKNVLLFLLALASAMLYSQSPIGGWEAETNDSALGTLKIVAIVSASHQAISWYSKKDGAFVRTIGGSYSLAESRLRLNIEFDSSQPETVGTIQEFILSASGAGYLVSPSGLIFTRLDDGKPGALPGAWLMSARKQNETLTARSTDQPRKTMKILSGTRFQWIAYDTETKQFMGTGGGNYTTVDGTYTENISFFSRDNSRVGASLNFTYSLKKGEWHHSGLSSKGEPIYEVWSQRQ